MISTLLVSKARKPKFDLTLKIIDLNNVPLVAGTSHIKWSLPAHTTTASTEHRGQTTKSPIREHKVSWDYTAHIPLRLTIDKANNLTECIIHFDVLQDFHNIGTKPERVQLGTLRLNLAEYVEESEMVASPVAGKGDGGEEEFQGVVRRYLMQESKINSTVKIGILMRQVDGERNFVAPPLKTAAVFGGIAGIMAGERAGAGENDDLHMPVLSKSRDHGELQDMYRRALAASWAAQVDELPADQCVEDIFNGGSGWKASYDGGNDHYSTPRISAHDDGEDHHHPHGRRHHRSNSGASAKSMGSQNTITKKASMGKLRGHQKSGSNETVGLGRQVDGASGRHGSSESFERDRVGSGGGFRSASEVDEFDVREDLVAWRLPGPAIVGTKS
ncbi:N-terminal C2 in EEIG1 and EHBP1 proteins-domain-containing protein [Tricladium varicosporioides]|nr:N-terminal C2 in EEIG1 and EHBP1 proteins-domain-containing protein [Hymenoscyphus varicosporioides]